MGKTANDRLSQLRAEYRVAERLIKQAEKDKLFDERAKDITAGWCWIPVTMLAGLVERIANKRRWLFDLALLEADGWRVRGKYIRGPQAYPEIPVRPPRVDVPTSADHRGGSSGGGGGSGRELTIDQARKEQQARHEHIAWLQSIADREEWDRRQEWRAWLMRDEVFVRDLMILPDLKFLTDELPPAA